MAHPPSPEVFDKQELLDRVEGDEEFAGEIVDVFLQHAPEMVAKLERDIEQGDVRTISRSAHELKGAASNIAAGTLTACARRVQEAADAEDLPAVRDTFDELRTSMEALRRQLQSAFVSQSGD